VSLQANTGELELLADQAITITATDNRIDVLAQQKVVLQAGNSAITLEGGDITFSCPGTFTVKAGQHPFLGGAKDEAFLPPLPSGAQEATHWIALNYMDVDTMQAMAGTPYEIHFEDGSKIQGKLDAEGKAHHGPIPEKKVAKVIYEPRDPTRDTAWPDLELIANLQGNTHG